MSAAAFAASVIIYTIMSVAIVSAAVGMWGAAYRHISGAIRGAFIHARNKRLGLATYQVDLHRERNLTVFNVRVHRTAEYRISDYEDGVSEGFSGEAAAR